MCYNVFFQVPGKVKFTDQHLIFKNSKTGKVDQINATDIDLANWQKLVGFWALRIFLKNGILHRFSGFRESVSTNKIFPYLWLYNASSTWKLKWLVQFLQHNFIKLMRHIFACTGSGENFKVL